MRLTTALFPTVTLLCTVFLAQAVPLIPSRNDVIACSGLTDCDSCVHASLCGFSLNTESCEAKEDYAGRLATSATQCKKATAIHAAREWNVAAKADAVWTQIKAHTLDGRPDKAESGRHLTSTWLGHADNKGTAAHMKINAATGLAQLAYSTGKGKKTYWIDSDAEGKATSIAHKYTRDQVAAVCKDAIMAALNTSTGKSRKSKKLRKVTSGSYSVRSPFGNNICVTVSNAQCYPASTDATTAAPGAKC
ncbi:uncharacterized protein B0H18DRAFT_1116209 [Fomitopsis serialis]|uniref:uncharacterized protein n=1 Tax=Fomitopsis serialis TaxID=139415 RepID=UPI002007F006|nr:uncharacterized protein B0H18DRAFT_1116209 [Neoantrodia serialis]KAH9931980.1 hypothetical protein B0H18DRAFT_1116209 [Neoantrodia serialis]